MNPSKSFKDHVDLALNEISNWNTQTLCAFLEKYEFNDARLVAESTNKIGYDFLYAEDKPHTWRLSKTRLKKFIDFVRTVRENPIYYVPIEAETNIPYENDNNEKFQNTKSQLARKLIEKLSIFEKNKYELSQSTEEESFSEKYHTLTNDSSFDEESNDYDDENFETKYETVPLEDHFENSEEEDIYADVEPVIVSHSRHQYSQKRRLSDAQKQHVNKNNMNIDVKELLETSSRFKSTQESDRRMKHSMTRNRIPIVSDEPRTSTRKEKISKNSNREVPISQPASSYSLKKNQRRNGSPIKSKPTTPTFAHWQNPGKHSNMRNTDRPLKMLPTHDFFSPSTSKFTKGNGRNDDTSDEDNGYLKPTDFEEVLQTRRGSESKMQAPNEVSKSSKQPTSFGTLTRPLPAPPKKNTKTLEPSQNPFIINVSRQMSEEILNGKNDGSFLFRPTKMSNCLCTLVVIYNQSAYHINVRENANGTLALGTSEKDYEPNFDNITEIIRYFQKIQLKIVSNNRVQGQVFLTDCYSYEDSIY